MGNRLYLGVFVVLLSAFGFGLMPLLAIYGYKGGASVSTVLFIRFTLAATCFFLFLKLRKIKITLTKKQLLALFLLGGVMYTTMSSLYFASVKYIPSSLAALCLNTYPVFVAILAVVFDKERIGKRMVIAIGLCMVGMFFVLGASFTGLNLFGVLMAVGAGVIYSTYIIIGNRLVKQLPPLVTTAFVTLFTSVMLLVSGLATGQIDFHIGYQSWIACAVLAFFSTIVAIFLQLKGLELIGTTRTSVLSLFEPITAIVLSAVVLREQMSALQMVGALIVLSGGVLVVTMREKTKKEPSLEEKAA